MAALTLPTLPAELLLEICHWLCWHCRTKTAAPLQCQHYSREVDAQSARVVAIWARTADLAALSSTCRRLRAVAQPVLHHNPWTAPHCMKTLQRTLSARPDLAGAVEQLDTWLKYDDAGLSRLLCLAPHLDVIYMHMPSRPSDSSEPFPPCTAAASSAAPPASLRTLAMRSIGFSAGILYFATPLFAHGHLANLRVLCLCGCVNVLPHDAPPLLDHLTELLLSGASMSMASFGHLLRHVGPHLSRVAIHCPYYPETSEDGDNYADIIDFFGPHRLAPDAVLRALLPWKQTLRDFSFVFYNESQRVLPRLSLAVLPEFAALESLGLNASILLLSSARPSQRDMLADALHQLPPELRALSLWGRRCQTLFLELLQEAVTAGRLSRLHHLTIDNQWYQAGSYTAFELDYALHALQEAGVQTTVRSA